ncbi:hypothetical protein RUND412_001457 [Rhizina undulata]
MKFLSIALVLGAAFVDRALAHYRFWEFINDGVTGSEFEYIRTYTSDNSPVTNVSSTDLRCNVGGLDSGSSTSTATVAAGSTIGFQSDIVVYHPGPFNVYLAQVPSGYTASTWDGSGEVWFRIWEKGAINITADAITFDTTDDVFTFTLPASLPDGDYFVRIEQIGLHVAYSYGGAQWYISCAQITVTGGGSGVPSPLVAIPGVYTGYEPGILINIYYPIPTNYTVPGPTIWSG